MNDKLFISILNNAALLLSLGLVYDVFYRGKRVTNPLLNKIISGIIIGVVAVVLMATPAQWESGIIFDTRTILIGLTGLFFGTIPTFIAMAIAGAYRFSLGGGGALMGIATIISSGLVGLTWKHYRLRESIELSLLELYLFGGVVHAVMILCMFLLPQAIIMTTLGSLALPVILIYPVCTALLGNLLTNRQKRHRAEDTLKQSEAQHRTILQTAIDGIWRTDNQGHIIEANESYCLMSGYSLQELKSMVVKDLVVNETAADVASRIQMINEKGEARFESWHRRKDGTIFAAEVSVKHLEDEGDHFVAFIRDATKRKQHETELINNERRIASLFGISQYPYNNAQDFLDHALNELIELTDSKIGYIYYYNEQTKQFTLNSWSNEAMKECSVVEKQTVYDLDKTGIWGEAVRQRRPILVNDFAANNLLKKGLPDGHVVLGRFLTVPVFISEVIVAVVGVANKESDYSTSDVMQLTLFMDSVWNILLHQRAIEENAKLEGQLIQSRKMEAVGQLAGGVAHDFNNMLGVIIGHSELALMKLQPSQPGYSNLTEIRAAAARSADLTRQLLAFARKQTIAPRVLDLNETMSGMLKMLQRLIGENINLSLNPAPNLWPVNFDPSQVDQIIANLCVNARDAISEVGRITIETGNSIIDASYCANHAYAEPGEYVRLAVSDDGAGMDKETTAHIFEPFFTTKGIGKGTGMGLATVYGIVKQNNGFINVYSEPGRGTTFTIYLHRHIAVSGVPLKEVIAEEAPAGTETVLLVEDEPAILEMAAMMLEMQGYTVLAAGNAGEALRLFAEEGDRIHLLMTDVVMPDMSGPDLARELESLKPQLKCLFMSGYTVNVTANHGLLDEGVHFIQKPFSLYDLATKLREVLDGKKLLSTVISAKRDVIFSNRAE